MTGIDLARIKGNVAKMAAQNAPEADIDGYIASEGTTVDAVKAFKMPATAAAAPKPSGYDASLPAQGLSGLNEGIANTLGAPVDLATAAANTVTHPSAALTNAPFIGPILGLTGTVSKALNVPAIPDNTIGSSASIKSAMGGAIKAPTNDVGGQMVRRVGQEVGAALIPGAGIVAREARPVAAALRQGATAVASGAGAAVANQIDPGNPYADLAGQILGGAGVAGVAKTVQKIVSPMGGIPAERQAAVNTMQREGVDLSAGQQTGDKGLQYTESELGGSGAQQFTEKQQQQFTQAALAKAGVAAERATPQVIDKAFTDVGQRFDDLEAGNTMLPDQQLGADLHSTVQEYFDLVPPSHRSPVVRKTVTDIANTLGVTGQYDGAAYQALRSRLRRLARSSSDPQLQDALNGIGDALDGAMERSIAKNNPSDLGNWQQARSDYRNLLVIEDAVSRPGEAATGNGIITPANLASSARKIQGKRSFARGQGDFSDLAHAGVQTMTPLPNSGTTPRAVVHATGSAVGAGLGALTGTGPVGPAVGAVVGLTAPRLLGGLMLSPMGRKWLTNNRLTGPIGVAPASVGPATSTLTRLTSTMNQPPSGQASDPSQPAGPGGPNGPLSITVQGANNALTMH